MSSLGVIITNFKGLWIHNSQKMKSEAFIHKDDMLCFHMVVQGTQK